MKAFVWFSVVSLLAFAVIAAFWLRGSDEPNHKRDHGTDELSVVNESARIVPRSVDILGIGTSPGSQTPKVTVTPIEPIERPPGPLRDQLNALYASAAQGKSVAAYQIFLGMEYCRLQPGSEAELATMTTRRLSNRIYLDNELADPAPDIQKLEAGFEYCQGVSAEEPSDAFEYLRMAAEGGLLPAQIRLGATPPPGQFDLASDDRLEQQRIATARAEGMRWRQISADAGSVEAFSWLAHAYEGGVMTERDLVLAYAYQRAAVAARLAAGDQRESPAQWLQNIARELHAHEIEEAERLAEEILSSPNCCKL